MARPGGHQDSSYLAEAIINEQITTLQLVPTMLRARPPLDVAEEQKIRKLAGARHAPADWIERARIIALSWDGLGVPAIAGQLGCHPKKVRRWLHRFNADGIDGFGEIGRASCRERVCQYV